MRQFGTLEGSSPRQVWKERSDGRCGWLLEEQVLGITCCTGRSRASLPCRGLAGVPRISSAGGRDSFVQGVLGWTHRVLMLVSATVANPSEAHGLGEYGASNPGEDQRRKARRQMLSPRNWAQFPRYIVSVR